MQFAFQFYFVLTCARVIFLSRNKVKIAKLINLIKFNSNNKEKMKTSTKILIPALALTIFSVAGAVGIESTLAQDGENHQSIAQKIATRFNLNQDEVEQVFEENRAEHKAQMEQRQGERLDQLVSEGKLTEDQKNALIAKNEEWRNEREQNREEFRSMTKKERKESMEAHKAEMEKWFEENGIEREVVGGFGDGHRKGGRGIGFER